MIRTLTVLLALALALALAVAGPALAAEESEYVGGVGLFSRADDSPLVVTPGVWITQGFAQIWTESSDSGKIRQDANVLATVDLDLRLPGAAWLGLWGRGGMTVSNRKGDSDTAEDVDSDFTVVEANLVITLVGRGSPLFESDNYPRSHLDLYAGGRFFREEYEAEIAGGVQREIEATWAGPQIGLRGEWYLEDTYDFEVLHGWSLMLRGAVLPWVHMESTDRRDGTTAFEQDSNRGYGADLAAGFNWRKGPFTLGLGYEALLLRADRGDEEDALGAERDLLEARSYRHGAFLSLSLNF